MKTGRVRNKKELELMRRNIQRYMEEKDLIMPELAAVAIIPLSSLSRILKGEVKSPGLDIVISFAKGLGVTVDQLFEDIPPHAE